MEIEENKGGEGGRGRKEGEDEWDIRYDGIIVSSI